MAAVTSSFMDSVDGDISNLTVFDVVICLFVFGTGAGRVSETRDFQQSTV